MKFLHTSDWHLGKCLMEESFYEEQKHILNEIIKVADEQKVEAILIAGDVYDKNIPSVDAVNIFNDFLKEITKRNIEVYIISGNHDSSDRLGFGAEIFDNFRIHIVSNYCGKMKIFSQNNVDFYLLPFVKPFHLKHFMEQAEYEKISDANEMMKWILSNEIIDKSKINVLVMHEFVLNAGQNIDFSDSESRVNVGTLDAIDVNLLDDFDYVALGHIHKPQIIKRETVRYSGTPLKYSFSEVNNENGVIIFDTDTKQITKVLLNPLRNFMVIQGYFNDIKDMEPSNDIIRIELLDENTIISPMDELKHKFPNAISLGFVSRSSKSDNIFSNNSTFSKDVSPIKLFEDFYSSQQEKSLNDEEKAYFNKLLEDLLNAREEGNYET